MRDGGYPDMPFNQQVTFPCELTLRTVDGRPHLFRHPIHELASLRSGTSEVSLSRCYLPTDRGIVLTATAPVQVATTLHTLDSIWPDR